MLVVPEIFRSFTFLGVDPGMTHCGVAKFSIRDSVLSSIDAITIETGKLPFQSELLTDFHLDRYLKLNRLCLAFQEILQETNPVIVCCESPFYNPRMPGAFGSLTETVSFLRSTTLAFNPVLPFITFAPQEVKQTFKRSGLLGKEVMKDSLLRNDFLRPLVIKPIQELDEHSIDAIAVGYTWYLSCFSPAGDQHV